MFIRSNPNDCIVTSTTETEEVPRGINPPRWDAEESQKEVEHGFPIAIGTTLRAKERQPAPVAARGRTAGWSSEQGRTEDALGIRAEEGRGEPRYAPGSRTQAMSW